MEEAKIRLRIETEQARGDLEKIDREFERTAERGSRTIKRAEGGGAANGLAGIAARFATLAGVAGFVNLASGGGLGTTFTGARDMFVGWANPAGASLNSGTMAARAEVAQQWGMARQLGIVGPSHSENMFDLSMQFGSGAQASGARQVELDLKDRTFDAGLATLGLKREPDKSAAEIAQHNHREMLNAVNSIAEALRK